MVGTHFEEQETDFDVPICRHYDVIRRSPVDFEVRLRNNNAHMQSPLEKIEEKEDEEEKIKIENEQKKSACYCLIV